MCLAALLPLKLCSTALFNYKIKLPAPTKFAARKRRLSMLADLQTQLNTRFADAIQNSSLSKDELTLVIDPKRLLEVAKVLRDECHFEQLLDVAGIDYSRFGV